MSDNEFWSYCDECEDVWIIGNSNKVFGKSSKSKSRTSSFIDAEVFGECVGV